MASESDTLSVEFKTERQDDDWVRCFLALLHIKYIHLHFHCSFQTFSAAIYREW